MNKEKNFNMGHITIEALGASIVSLLLKEGKVVIPELGYLELKVFPDKRSVLFKATENAALFLDSEGLIQSSIYNNISVPLKEGKSVTLPEVGIFRTMKNADDSFRVSFTISSALRNLLNDTEKSESGVIKPEAHATETLVKADDKKPIVLSNISANEKQNVGEEEKKEKREVVRPKRAVISVPEHTDNISKTDDLVVVKPKRAVISVPENTDNISKTDDLVVSKKEKKRNVTKMRNIIVTLAATVILIFIVWYFTSERKNTGDDYAFVAGNNKAILTIDQSKESIRSDKSIDLPSLAERKYGNRIFWVYIYEANRDKISSPVNIPAGIELRIPNLWEDYKVDVTDSMEIKRAEMLSDSILKQKI
jgi:hypothetical protein